MTDNERYEAELRSIMKIAGRTEPEKEEEPKEEKKAPKKQAKGKK